MKIKERKRDWEEWSNKKDLADINYEDTVIEVELDNGKTLVFWGSEWGGVYLKDNKG